MRPNEFQGTIREGETFKIQSRAVDIYGKLHVPGSFDSYAFKVWQNGAQADVVIAQAVGLPGLVLFPTLRKPWRGDSIGYNLEFAVTPDLFDPKGGASYHMELALIGTSDPGTVLWIGDISYLPTRS